MREQLPNFIYGAIYRTKCGRADSSATNPRYHCYTPAYPDTPPEAYIADCWVCDPFGQIDPGLNISPIPVRHEDLGRIINTVKQGHRM